MKYLKLHALNKSKFEEKFEEVQQTNNFPALLKIYGDSAYSDTDVIATDYGQGLSSVRESIEWSCKDTKMQWKYCDYETVLRGQPLAKIVFVCMLLRNAHLTFHAGQITDYFEMIPPSFETWVSQGPAAHPIPDTSVFSQNYDGAGDSDDEVDSDSDLDDD